MTLQAERSTPLPMANKGAEIWDPSFVLDSNTYKHN